MQNLIEAEVAEASERQDLMALHQELQVFFNQPALIAFKDQLKQRLMEEAARHRSRRRWRRLVWSAGSIAAALLIFTLMSPSVLDFKTLNNQVQISQETSTGGTGTQVPGSTGSIALDLDQPTPKIDEPYKTDSRASMPASKGAGAGDTVVAMNDAPAAPAVPTAAVTEASAGDQSKERFSPYGTSSVNRAGAAPAPMMMKSAAAATALPSAAVIYQERGREISPSEAAGIASLFGFQGGSQAGGGYSYTNQENQSTLTISSGSLPTTISYRRGVVSAGPGISVQTAVNKALQLVVQMPYLEGNLGEPARVRYSDPLSNSGSRQCIIFFDRWLNGSLMLDRSITVTVDLGSGDVVGFTAVADVFEPQGSYPIIPREEIVSRFGANLLRVDLVLMPENSGGAQRLMPLYLVAYQNSQGAAQSSLVDAIQPGY
ncbi:MAG: hypothetical protein HPY50_14605 [Firmicutes bacterium]|nr:hypothetical protein [Bacillota bacterium]